MKEKEFFDEMNERKQIADRDMKIDIFISFIIWCIISIVTFISSYNSMWKSYPEEIYKRLELMTANEGEKINDLFAVVELLEIKSNVTIKEFTYGKDDFKISYYSTEYKDNMQGFPTITITLSKKGEILSKVRNYSSQQEYVKSAKKEVIRKSIVNGALCCLASLIAGLGIIGLIFERQMYRKKLKLQEEPTKKC